LIARIIADIHAAPTVVDRMAWESVGPQRLTDNWRASGYANLTIYPSHYFIPRHFSGVEYTGPGTVYAKQEWASTLGGYDRLHEKEVA
jgi:mannosyltransferase OCH1-like enzyme